MIHFRKYQGTGNDFILLDNRQGAYSRLSQQEIAFLCDRRFGIGADGLMFLQQHQGYDFEMVYFNADGAEGSMCGNGGRCIVRYAQDLGLVTGRTRFLATDGPHEALLRDDGTVELKMNDVHAINSSPSHAQLNTGSPHYVQWVSDVDAVDVVGDGRSIRYSPPFASEGINVNFAERKTGYIAVRTYERGVENETLSCGTGVTAVALAAATGEGPQETTIRTPGGTLNIRFCKTASGHFEEVWLCGPATFVFEGSLDLSNRRLS